MTAPPLTTTTRLRSLPTDPSRKDLIPIAALFAKSAHTARYPEKSLAASLRTVTAVRPDLVSLFEAETRGQLAELQKAPVRPPPAPPTGRWLTEVQAAERLDRSLRHVRSWLTTVSGRYSLGWPWYDGRRWYVAEPAINPTTRAAYMATLPSREPLAHVARLPVWCSSDPASTAAE
jgi:hypothetical protein